MRLDNRLRGLLGTTVAALAILLAIEFIRHHDIATRLVATHAAIADLRARVEVESLERQRLAGALEQQEELARKEDAGVPDTGVQRDSGVRQTRIRSESLPQRICGAFQGDWPKWEDADPRNEDCARHCGHPASVCDRERLSEVLRYGGGIAFQIDEPPRTVEKRTERERLLAEAIEVARYLRIEGRDDVWFSHASDCKKYPPEFEASLNRPNSVMVTIGSNGIGMTENEPTRTTCAETHVFVCCRRDN